MPVRLTLERRRLRRRLPESVSHTIAAQPLQMTAQVELCPLPCRRPMGSDPAHHPVTGRLYRDGTARSPLRSRGLRRSGVHTLDGCALSQGIPTCWSGCKELLSALIARNHMGPTVLDKGAERP